MRVYHTAAYIPDNLYDRINESNTSTKNTSGESANQTKETNSSSGYRITFSNDLSIARIQEAMGLNPTGKLKLKDLETVAEDRKDFVSLTLKQTLQSLGINPDQDISLSLGAENKIGVSGDFPEKAELEEALNENKEFTKAFMQLTANQSVLDYVSQLQQSVQNPAVSLVDYYNSDTDFNDLLSLASEYKRLKSNNFMGTLLDLSSSETPYTYIYDEKGE
ncbi:MAG: hypothetical protein PVG39_28050 [Desulfobacteraceae bacterium]|jgi:hypothetical protein